MNSKETMQHYYIDKDGEFSKEEPLPEENDDPRTGFFTTDLSPAELEKAFEEWYEKPHTPKKKEYQITNEEIYWYEARWLIHVWAKYSKVSKLLKNAEDTSTRHRVWHVVKKTYGGDLERVNDRKATMAKVFQNELDYFNLLCEENEVAPIDETWLETHVNHAKFYKSMRNKCLTRMRNGTMPCSLRDLV